MPRDPYKLDVFHGSHALSLDVYRLSKRFPADERHGLTSQIRRAATSVPTNIVEGCVRLTASEYRHFIGIALGSAAEVHYLLGLAADLKYLEADDVADCRERSDHVVRKLQRLLAAIAGFERQEISVRRSKAERRKP